MTHKPSELGQTDLVFGLWPEFISRSVHARLKVCVFSGYDLWSSWLTHRQTDSFWPIILLAQPSCSRKHAVQFCVVGLCADGMCAVVVATARICPQYGAVYRTMPYRLLCDRSLLLNMFPGAVAAECIFSDSDEHRPAPLWRFCYCDSVYECHDLVVYCLLHLFIQII